MEEQKQNRRNRHNEELMQEKLLAAIKTIDAVADVSGKTFEQVAYVYRAQFISRLTEILIDAGDSKDWNLNDIKSFISNEMQHHRNWCYDNQPLKVEIEK